MRRNWTARRPNRVVLGILASLAVIVPLSVLWSRSLLPDSYSVMDMGYPEYGGGPGEASSGIHAMGHHTARMPGDVSVTDLDGPRSRRPDVSVTLVARQEPITLPNGASVDGFTLNHTSPGPLLRVRQGDLLQVTLVNDSVAGGATLHWHGVDLPNADDGVAGVTQDAVRPGGRHVYRFVADDPGTYWYHSHQVSHEQVRGGLFGVLVVEPARRRDEVDVVAAVHTYGGLRTLDGASGGRRVIAEPGETVRVRTVNTDNGALEVTVVGTPYRVLAVDGRDVVDPGPLEGQSVQLAAGGRTDLGFVMPADASAVRVQLGADGSTSLIVGQRDAPTPDVVQVEEELDLLSYGSPTPIGFDPREADRRFDYSIGRRPGFLDGMPGLYWTINGHLFPDVPMFMVAEGDVVRMTLENHSGEAHPMHLHGHHAVVLSRNGVPASGSPWWVDSLDVASGDSYEIAFVADNPGIWMDHCHNLPHAAEGLVAHLAYTGVTTPFRIGGQADNEPE
jgi:FtsP/CotA-like multicopper oxidase with cupredoxin domain